MKWIDVFGWTVGVAYAVSLVIGIVHFVTLGGWP